MRMNETLHNSRNEIEKLLNGFILQNKNHVDIITDHLPVLSTLDYVTILLEKDNKK